MVKGGCKEDVVEMQGEDDAGGFFCADQCLPVLFDVCRIQIHRVAECFADLEHGSASCPGYDPALGETQVGGMT